MGHPCSHRQNTNTFKIVKSKDIFNKTKKKGTKLDGSGREAKSRRVWGGVTRMMLKHINKIPKELGKILGKTKDP